MLSKPVMIGAVIGVFFAGLGIGYAVFQSAQPDFTHMTPQQMQQMMNNPQVMNQWMNSMMSNPQTMQQMHDIMMNNPQHMQTMMNTMGPAMMGSMMNNPQASQQLMNTMMQNQQFMQGMMSNQQFQQAWMGPWMNNSTNWQGMMGSGMMPNGMMGSGSGMGSGMMGNTVVGGTYKTVSIKNALDKINSVPNGAKVNQNDDVMTFSTSSVDLASFAMMGQDAIDATGYTPPSDAHALDDVFVIGGLINPTLAVKSGTQLRITLVNLDEDMAHNFVITKSIPPYSYMPMQGMMGANDIFLNTMPILPNEEKQSGNAYEYTVSVTLNKPGTYWYICTYPGHAAEGMYGKIIVQ